MEAALLCIGDLTNEPGDLIFRWEPLWNIWGVRPRYLMLFGVITLCGGESYLLLNDI